MSAVHARNDVTLLSRFIFRLFPDSSDRLWKDGILQSALRSLLQNLLSHGRAASGRPWAKRRGATKSVKLLPFIPICPPRQAIPPFLFSKVHLTVDTFHYFQYDRDQREMQCYRRHPANGFTAIAAPVLFFIFLRPKHPKFASDDYRLLHAGYLLATSKNSNGFQHTRKAKIPVNTEFTGIFAF